MEKKKELVQRFDRLKKQQAELDKRIAGQPIQIIRTPDGPEIKGRSITPMDDRMAWDLGREIGWVEYEIRKVEELLAPQPSGRPAGMTKERLAEAQRLEELCKMYRNQRGVLKKAAKQVYPNVSPELAYDRARQTLKDYRKTKNRENNPA